MTFRMLAVARPFGATARNGSPLKPAADSVYLGNLSNEFNC